MKTAKFQRAVIRITDLALRAIIGANPWERTSQQDIIINVTIEFDAGKASITDNLSDTLDYKKIKRDIIALVDKSRFKLLETLTSRILAAVMRNPEVLAAAVRIDKPSALRFARSVSIEMHGERD